MHELHTCQVEIRGRIDEKSLTNSSPLPITAVSVKAESTRLSVRTDQSGLIGLLRHLHTRGFDILSVHFE